MNSVKPSVDDYVKYGREFVSLMVVILLIVALVSIAMAINGSGAWVGRLHDLQVIIPMFVIFIAAWAQIRRRKLGLEAKQSAWQAMFEDEFRRQNMSKACRAALIFVLVLQMPLGFILDKWLPSVGMVFMGYLTLLLGVITFLTLFLFFGRNVK